MASASTKTPDAANQGKPQPLPQGFVSPFRRVAMAGRIDDLLACIATLTGRTLAEITQAAIASGYPAHGPALLTEAQTAAVLIAEGLVSTKYKEFRSLQHLPDVTILQVDASEEMWGLGRHVICHRVHATSERKAFMYVIDPATWITEDRHMTTSLEMFEPDCFIGISKASTTAIKGSKGA